MKNIFSKKVLVPCLIASACLITAQTFAQNKEKDKKTTVKVREGSLSGLGWELKKRFSSQ